MLVPSTPHFSKILQRVKVFSGFLNVCYQRLFFNTVFFQQFLCKLIVRLSEWQDGFSEIFGYIFGLISVRRKILYLVLFLLNLLFTTNDGLLLVFWVFVDDFIEFRRMIFGLLSIDLRVFLDFDGIIGFCILVVCLFFGSLPKRDVMKSSEPTVRVKSIVGVEVRKRGYLFEIRRTHWT